MEYTGCRSCDFMILNLVALVLQLIFGMHVRMNLGLCCRILNKRIDLNVSSNWKSCCFVYRFLGLGLTIAWAILAWIDSL